MWPEWSLYALMSMDDLAHQLIDDEYVHPILAEPLEGEDYYQSENIKWTTRLIPEYPAKKTRSPNGKFWWEWSRLNRN